MSPEAALLRVLLALPPSYYEPAEPSRAGRLGAVATILAGYPRDVAAGLIMLGQSESGFAAYVAGGCFVVPKGAPDCDGGTALGYWQLKRQTCPTGWAFPPWTLSSLREQVGCAARLWRGLAWRCLPRGGGFGCVWADRGWSAARYSVILSKVAQ